MSSSLGISKQNSSLGISGDLFSVKMASGAWQEQLMNAKITCLNQDNKLKAHFQIDASTEMAEEYDAR